MRSDAIWVKKPTWVRIVNPDPIRILGMSWEYGAIALIRPGGHFRTICVSGLRVLAMYQPPHAPYDVHEAPPDTLVLYTLEDLRLLADGTISDAEPFDDPVPTRAPRAPAHTVRVGDHARVPKSRRVHATPPHAIRDVLIGGPYRAESGVERLNRLSEWATIRPGGTMTVFTFLGEEPSALLKARYRSNPDYIGEQCPSGYWFHIPEETFLGMEEEYRRRRELEDLERAVVISMLRSL
jgi:hypothetical protein